MNQQLQKEQTAARINISKSHPSPPAEEGAEVGSGGTFENLSGLVSDYTGDSMFRQTVRIDTCFNILYRYLSWRH